MNSEKTALLFPGQGAQYIGMGQDLYNNMQTARDVFDLAQQATGIDVKSICFEDEEKLIQTRYAQIALLTVEIAILRCSEEYGLDYQASIGLSLGEYSSIVASKSIREVDAYQVIQKRGSFMQDAYPVGGAMAAINGLNDVSVIEQVCRETLGIVSIANYNCIGQIVITGEEVAVNAACIKLENLGARRCQRLNVSGPFHSSFMKSAGEELREVLEGIEVFPIQIPYVSNVTGDYVINSKDMKDLLVKQISEPVCFMQGIQKLIENGVTRFIEMGPKSTLTALVRRINKDIKVFHIETFGELNRYFDEL